MSDAAFQASILASPTDTGHRRIYADWLEEQARPEDARRERACAEAVDLAFARGLVDRINSVARHATRNVRGTFGIPVRFERGTFRVGNIEITAPAPHAFGTVVRMDGQEVRRVRGILLYCHIDTDEIWRCELDLLPDSAEEAQQTG